MGSLLLRKLFNRSNRSDDEKKTKDQKRKFMILVDYENVTLGLQDKKMKGIMSEIDPLDDIIPDFAALIAKYMQQGEIIHMAAFAPNTGNIKYNELNNLGFLVCVSEAGEGKDYGKVDRNLIRNGMRMLLNMNFDELIVVSDDGDLIELYNETIMRDKKVTVLEVHRVHNVVAKNPNIYIDKMPTRIRKGKEIVGA